MAEMGDISVMLVEAELRSHSCSCLDAAERMVFTTGLD